MYHVTIITYHIKRKLALLCGNWKLQQRVIFVYVSLLKQQGISDFKFISVSFSAVTVSYIRYQHTVSLKLYDLKIESFFFHLIAVSTLKKLSIKKKNTFWFVFIISYYWY